MDQHRKSACSAECGWNYQERMHLMSDVIDGPKISNSLAIEKTQPSHHLSSAAGHMGDRDVKDSDRGK